jgi:TolB-like protein
LPPHIRTVAIMPFDNQTGEATLTQEVSEKVREALENRLGLRLAGEDQADAVVTGTISNYEADLPLSFQPTAGGNVSVTSRLVRIRLSVEIFDRREERVLWQRAGMTVEGEYRPPSVEDGRTIALDKLVTDIVDGAQSQW